MKKKVIGWIVILLMVAVLLGSPWFLWNRRDKSPKEPANNPAAENVKQAPEVKAQAVTPAKEEILAMDAEGETTIDVVLPKVRYIVPPSEVIVSGLAETPPPSTVKPLIPVVSPPVPATIEQKVEVVVVPDVSPSPALVVAPPTPQRMVIHPRVKVVYQAPPPEKIYSNSQP